MYFCKSDSDDDDLSTNYSSLSTLRLSQDECENSRSDESCSSTSTLKLQPRWNRRHVYEFGEFGEFENSHGWVECQSKSYPNRLYYHNMHSNCDTWYRPVSRLVSIPRVSTENVNSMNCTDNSTTIDLELMMVSDNENERNASAVTCDLNGSSIETPLDIIERCYYTPSIDLTFDMRNNSNELSDLASEYCNEREQKDENNHSVSYECDNDDVKEEEFSTFDVADFLETEFRVGDEEITVKWEPRIIQPLWDEDNSNSSDSNSSPPSVAPRVIYGIPQLKKIRLKHQLVKWKRTRVSKDQGGLRKIICEVNGVRTINYDLPPPDEVRPEAGVKSSKLSESDSDDNMVSSPSQLNVKKTWPYDSGWCDLVKNLRQPLLSDPSSSSSSRSSISTSSRSSSSSCSSNSSSKSNSSCSSSCSSSCNTSCSSKISSKSNSGIKPNSKTNISSNITNHLNTLNE